MHNVGVYISNKPSIFFDFWAFLCYVKNKIKYKTLSPSFKDFISLLLHTNVKIADLSTKIK